MTLGKRVAAAGFIYLLLPRQSAQFRSSTCALLHRLHPKNEYPQASRACKYPSFCCRRKRSVRYGDSPFPASAVAKGINTLDFAAQNRVPTGCCSPLLETLSQRDCIPLDTCNFLHTTVPKLKKRSLPSM